MLDLTLVTLILVFVIPFLMVALTLVSKHARHKWLHLSGISLVMVGLLFLGLWGEGEINTALTFMGEPITFSISNTAILLYLGTLVVLGGLVWHDGTDDPSLMTPYQWGLLHLALSFGFIAFISGQFMVRYITLDIVGLLAGLTVLSTFSATWGLRQFIVIFQILRLGDLSLLASILLINHRAGTLNISEMITAAEVMPADERMWVFLGFLLALLVKLGIWPFGIWLERARKAAPRVSFWISGVLVPALGYYLLYRVAAIINSAVIFQTITLVSVIALGLLIVSLTVLRVINYDRFAHMGGLMSCFLLAAIAFGGSQFLLYYLLGLILMRWLLFLEDESSSPVVSALISYSPFLLNGLYIGFNRQRFSLVFLIGWAACTLITVTWDVWMQRKTVTVGVTPVPHTNSSRLSDEHYGGILVKTARWLNQTLELGILTQGVTRLSKAFHQFADWMYQNIEQRLEKLWIWIGRKLIAISEGTWKIEQQLENFLVWISKKLLAVSEGTLQKVEVETAQSTGHLMNEALNSLEAYEQNVLKKALRWDLAWIPFLLVVILVMLFVL